ncbi:hypothetical protein MMC12_001831 [Toensbergia leucococca]|nr:hypothetical protein [Toensbergia leucococca]
MAVSLAGRTAIVTGAGSGINLSFAHLLLSKRCNVIFADLALRPEAQELVSSHSSASQSPAKAVFQKTDVTDWQQLERMFHVADKEFGGVDVVCPGAGVYEPAWSSFWNPPGHPPSTDSPNSSHYRILDINLTHPLRATQLALSHFLSPRTKSRHPASLHNPKSIIHISSIAAQVTPLPFPLYNASKYALSGFVRSLAPLEARLGVRVTAVAPGVIRTPLWTEDAEKKRLIVEGADEWVEAEEVARVMGALVEEAEVVVEGVGAGEGEKRRVRVEGGMILEVAAKGRVRVVEQFGDPGPSGAGNTVGRMGVAEEEVFEKLGGGRWGRQ